jgi:hypothetical protein
MADAHFPRINRFWGKQLFALALVALLAYWIWSTDTFQQHAFPRDYWAKEVRGHRFMVTMMAKAAAMCRMDVAEFLRTTDLAHKNQEISGPTAADGDRLRDSSQTKYQAMLERCRFTDEILESAQHELEHAVSQLRMAGGAN